MQAFLFKLRAFFSSHAAAIGVQIRCTHFFLHAVMPITTVTHCDMSGFSVLACVCSNNSNVRSARTVHLICVCTHI